MRVLHLSTYDQFGGAAIAAMRLHRALVTAGVASRMLVRQKRSADPTVTQPGAPLLKGWLRLQRRWDRWPLARLGAPARNFSLGRTWSPVAAAVGQAAPDVVHAHWVADGFLRLETLAALAAPVVWTMHDMWAFTGGCHYPGDCDGFCRQCGACPALGSKREHDFSRSGWQRRQELYARRRLTLVAPSRWMAAEARRSTLLREADVRVIPNGIDTTVFAPGEREAARRRLGLPADKILLLAGAVQFDDPRKGFASLREALRELTAGGFGSRFELLVFGEFAAADAALPGVTVRPLGVLRGDATVATAYAAADLFVLPSREDNLPNTALEAMSVGIPVIAHSVGGIPDLVDDGVDGLLVAPNQPGALAAALARALGDPVSREAWGRAAREKIVRSFDAARCAAAHQALYEEILSRA